MSHFPSQQGRNPWKLDIYPKITPTHKHIFCLIFIEMQMSGNESKKTDLSLLYPFTQKTVKCEYIHSENDAYYLLMKAKFNSSKAQYELNHFPI